MSDSPDSTQARRLLLPLLLLVALAVPFAFWGDLVDWLGSDVLQQTMETVRLLVGSLTWLLLAFVVDRLLSVLVWDGVMQARLGAPVPRLLRNVASILIYLSAVGGIVGVVFQKSLTILFAATGGAGIVIGFAIQALISDFFSGIVLSIQRPFKEGGWVCIDGEGATSTRSTGVPPRSSTPRARSSPSPTARAGMKIINTTHAGHLRQHLWVKLDYEVPVEQAVRVLRAAVRSGQREVADLEPSVESLRLDDYGINYRIRFWLPHQDLWFECFEEMIAAIQHHLDIAGIRYSHSAHLEPSSRVEFRPPDDRQRQLELVRRVGLFDSLSKEQTAFLVDEMSRRSFAHGDDVVVQGEEGDSMFLIAEGLLDVFVFFQDQGKEMRVAQIDAGKFLGEISLLTGEPRSATVRAGSDCVLFEITHPVMKRLFEMRRPWSTS